VQRYIHVNPTDQFLLDGVGVGFEPLAGLQLELRGVELHEHVVELTLQYRLPCRRLLRLPPHVNHLGLRDNE